MRKMQRILLADDDQAFCGLLKEYLARQGYDVDVVHDGASAISRATDGAYDAMILDVMMPRADGFRVLKELRSPGRMPILMLTARGEDVDKIVGLEMGADDYLAKPCNPRELAARLKAILRRTQPQPASGDTIVCGDVELVTAARSVKLRGQPLELTGAEFDVLRARRAARARRGCGPRAVEG
jgi:DNA-binding response OmpR family regulator